MNEEQLPNSRKRCGNVAYVSEERRAPFSNGQRGDRSIGTSVGEEPTWIAPSCSKPWRW